MSSRALAALAVAGLAALASSSQSTAAITLGNGQSVNLDVVLASNDHQVIIGDKIFTFETYTSVSFNAANIAVVGFISPNFLDGTGFDLNGGFGDLPGDTSISEFNIRFTVEVQPAFANLGYRIKDVGLVFNGSASGSGSYARVDESVFNYNGVPGQNLIANSSVFAFGSGTPTAQLQASAVFGPPGYTKIEVNKDVQFYANGTGGSASASFVRQSFSQVPSPGSLGLLGLAGLVVSRRRRA